MDIVIVTAWVISVITAYVLGRGVGYQIGLTRADNMWQHLINRHKKQHPGASEDKRRGV